jgi:hypothetical protein
MATRPYIFHPVKSRDVHQRPVKTFKHYRITDTSFNTGSGATRYDAIYLGRQYPEINVGDSTYGYPENTETGTNKHVVWHGIDHRYYDRPFDPTMTQELYDIKNTHKFLWYSASIMSIPYFDMGERIRKNSVRLNIDGPGDINYTATDDGYGNLRDHQIDSASFASSSKSVLHLSFNNEYRQFRFQQGGLGTPTHPFPYFLKTAPTNLNHYQKQTANTYEYKDIDIVRGVRTTGYDQHSGLAAHFKQSGSYIRLSTYTNGIPPLDSHREVDNPFESFGFCDDYTISFWVKRTPSVPGPYTLLSKNTIKRVARHDSVNGTYFEDVVHEPPAIGQNFDNHRTPFAIGVIPNTDDTVSYRFHASNGSTSVHLSGSSTTTTGDEATAWDHVLIRNKNSNVQMYLNGSQVASDRLPKGKLGNEYDIMLGSSVGGFYSNRIIESPISTDLTTPDNVIRYIQSDLLIEDEAVFTIGENTVVVIQGNLTIEPSASMVLSKDSTVYVAESVTLEAPGDLTDSIQMGFDSTLIFGDRTGSDGWLDFHMAELRMYDYAVDETGISSLSNRNFVSGSLYQTSVMGNTFYKQGAIVVTSPLEKHVTGSGVFFPGSNESFDLRYRGCHTIYENEVMVRIPAGKLNVSTNPTATFRTTTKGGNPCLPFERQSMPGYNIKSMFVSGTADPYITTIGLYDRYRRLLAVGKLSQAVQKRPDIDTNIILRWDY